MIIVEGEPCDVVDIHISKVGMYCCNNDIGYYFTRFLFFFKGIVRCFGFGALLASIVVDYRLSMHNSTVYCRFYKTLKFVITFPFKVCQILFVPKNKIDILELTLPYHENTKILLNRFQQLDMHA